MCVCEILWGQNLYSETYRKLKLRNLASSNFEIK